jgi:hypothetical protein
MIHFRRDSCRSTIVNGTYRKQHHMEMLTSSFVTQSATITDFAGSEFRLLVLLLTVVAALHQPVSAAARPAPLKQGNLHLH